jgi:hypothetical protein
VCRHRRATHEQLLDQDEARERVATAAAVLARQRQADPAARAQRPTEARWSGLIPASASSRKRRTSARSASAASGRGCSESGSIT